MLQIRICIPLVKNPPVYMDILLVAEKIAVELQDDIEWETFGLHLLRTTCKDQLTSIQRNSKDLKEKCKKLLSLWERTSSNPEWMQVTQALRKINLKRLAKELEKAIVVEQLDELGNQGN